MTAYACGLRGCMRAAIAAITLGMCTHTGAQPKMSAPRTMHDGATQHIDSVLDDPQVARHLGDWGLTGADVRAHVAELPVAERARLAWLLSRRWRTGHEQSAAQLQAQFLATVLLLREATARADDRAGAAARR